MQLEQFRYENLRPSYSQHVCNGQRYHPKYQENSAPQTLRLITSRQSESSSSSENIAGWFQTICAAYWTLWFPCIIRLRMYGLVFSSLSWKTTWQGICSGCRYFPCIGILFTNVVLQTRDSSSSLSSAALYRCLRNIRLGRILYNLQLILYCTST